MYNPFKKLRIRLTNRMNRWYLKKSDCRAVIMFSRDDDGTSCFIGGRGDNIYNLIREAFDGYEDFFNIVRDACMAKMNDDIKEMESRHGDAFDAKKIANMSLGEFVAKIQEKEDAE